MGVAKELSVRDVGLSFRMANGVVAVPFDDRENNLVMTKNLIENSGKKEWVLGHGLQWKKVRGLEYPGGKIENKDWSDGVGRSFSKVPTDVVYKAAKREIGEELGMNIDAIKGDILGPMWVIQLRDGGITMFNVAYFLWNIGGNGDIFNEKKLQRVSISTIKDDSILKDMRPRDEAITRRIRKYIS